MLKWSRFAGVPQDWDRRVLGLGGNLHQCHGWGQYRAAMGWEVARFGATDAAGSDVAAAQLLLKRKAGVTIAWLPGGISGPLESAARCLTTFLRQEFGMLTYCRANYQGPRDPTSDAALSAAGWRRPSARLASGLSMELDLSLDTAQRAAQASGN